jgi:hypothetical protein
MQCNLWWNWHNVIVFGLHIGLHIHRCESMTKSDCSSWMQCDLWRNQKRHGNFVMDQRISCSGSTPVAAWAWPTWVVSWRCVLEVVFVLLESPSPSRRIFIGSHSLPPLWFTVSVLHLWSEIFHRHGDDDVHVEVTLRSHTARARLNDLRNQLFLS